MSILSLIDTQCLCDLECLTRGATPYRTQKDPSIVMWASESGVSCFQAFPSKSVVVAGVVYEAQEKQDHTQEGTQTCAHVCPCIHMYTQSMHIYPRTHLLTHTHTHTYTCAHTSMRTLAHPHPCIHTCAQMCTHPHAAVHTYMHAHVHIPKHLCTHMHIHVPVCTHPCTHM